ncbi:DUF3376 domain-containing protein [Amycolatopsis alba]|uniref:DUF3376 domain-containing protein n=1 Tax=Amycolatopsis alba DSM 44262 TaxID=1125972 RepID=A0A229RXQ8_AMYAL|nr:DUF3376 domain-containing protein [Amycolatopsis alba]OXM51305.1 DUF3376 domain-containing protein [Amycolatopsis alba DSM 44262]
MKTENHESRCQTSRVCENGGKNPPLLPHDLRLALCMRGGVSLAVWMGGACREITALRSAGGVVDEPPAVTARDRTQRAIYHEILTIAGYDNVEVDVIAGTSAGGLNGALLASHLVYGMRFDDGIRDIWLKLGDLESLTRHPKDKIPPSLLDGDGGFYQRLTSQLHHLLDTSCETSLGTGNSPRLVRLILTATRLFPRNEYLRPSVGQALLASWSQAHLAFRHYRTECDVAHPIFSDFPAGSTGHLDRLAYAARTTSSFPGAFEPARLTVTGPQNIDRKPWRNAVGTCSETGVPDVGSKQAQLMDGGVLDNIPLSWAIRAVAGAPAQAPVDRWLLYLQPVPPTPPKLPPTSTQQGSLARMARVVKALIRTKMNSETLLDDAAELSDAWTSAQRLHGTAGGLPGDPDLAHLPDVDARRRLMPRYADAVASVEADRLARLVDDPISLTGPDPLPIPDSRAFTGGQATAPILEHLRGPAVADLVCMPCTETLTVSWFRSLLAPARAVALVLDWVQAIEAEHELSPEQKKEISEIRDKLYETRFVCEVLLAARDRLLLRGGSPDFEVLPWVLAACQRLACFLEAAGGLTDEKAWCCVVAEVAEHAVQADLLPVGRDFPQTFLEPIWKRVAELSRLLVSRLTSLAKVPGFTALYEATTSRPDKTLEVFAIAELIIGPIRPDPLSEPSRIRVHAMSAVAESPLEPLLLGDAPLADDVQRVERKLSGNQLMNFASFLSSRWRLNDWTWGRLDAACSLVDVVARSERLLHKDDADLVRWLKDLYTEHYVAVFGKTSDDLEARPELAGLIGPWEALNVTTANVRHKLPILLTTWLHWNILQQEIPLLTGLAAMKSNGDLPPTSEQLKKASDPPFTRLVNEAHVLGDVGSETVRKLFKHAHLRRAGLRLGLVAWRAVQPAGKSKGARFGRTLFAVTKPMVVPPLLIGFLAPLWSAVAGLLAWAAVSVGTDSWFSMPGHLFLAIGVGFAGGYFCWHYLPDHDGTTPFRRVAAFAVGTFLFLLGLGLVLRGVESPFALGRWQRAAFVGGFSALSVLVSLWGVTAVWIRTGLWRRLTFVVLTALVPALLAASLTALSAVVLWPGEPLTGWMAAGTLYLTIAGETLMLTRFFPDPPLGQTTGSAGS